MTNSQPSLSDNADPVHRRRRKRRRLTPRSQWAAWAFGAGLILGVLVVRLLPVAMR